MVIGWKFPQNLLIIRSDNYSKTSQQVPSFRTESQESGGGGAHSAVESTHDEQETFSRVLAKLLPN